jgi:hypothetical protein
MATEAEIASIRRATGLEAEDEVYTDELIDGLHDDLGFDPTVELIWREKAAAYAGLVDTTESGSSRRLSQLADNALKMAGSWTTPEVEEAASGSYTVEIERV